MTSISRAKVNVRSLYIGYAPILRIGGPQHVSHLRGCAIRAGHVHRLGATIRPSLDVELHNFTLAQAAEALSIDR